MEYFKEIYMAKIKSLKNTGNIVIKELSEKYDDIDEKTFEFAKNRISKKYVTIPESYFKYYFPNRSLDLNWFCCFENYTEYGGFFHLKTLSLFLNNPLDTAFKANVSLDDAKLLKDGYRFFDRPNEYDRAAIKITDGKIEEKVYFINELNIPQKMVLTYPEYMEQVIKIKGLQHWQYLFIEGLKFDDVQFGLERELGERLKMIKEVFPDEDFTEFFKLFEGLR